MITLRRRRGSPMVFINGELSKPVSKALDDALSYYVENYERTNKFLMGEWDGKERLLKLARNGTFYFPFGLIDRVCSIFRMYSVPFVICDDTVGNKPNPVPNTVGKISLRKYQQEALNLLIDKCHGASGVIALPTGGGKTLISLAWFMHLKTDAIVLVHRKELFTQWRDEILKHTDVLPEEIGFVNDSTNDLASTPGKRVYICMVQSLYSKMVKKTIGDIKTGLLIADECHTIPARAAYRVMSQISAEYRLGLSATPTRSDGAEMKIWAACGVLSQNVTVESLVEQKHIAKPTFRMINHYSTGLTPWDRWANIYKLGIVLSESRNEGIRRIAEFHLKEGRQVYIHVAQVAHGKILKNLIPNSEWVYGSTKKQEREQIIADFKSGKIRCLISTLLKEGVSIDGISCLIYAQGMKSEIAVVQTIGRALRIDPQFNDALIYDFIDSGHKHLVEHTEQRIMTYRKFYGDLFQY